MNEQNRSDGQVTVFSQITDYIRAGILAGDFLPHDALPSERAVAMQFDVSRMTARRALEAIEHEGLAYSADRKGRFVSPRRLTYDVNSMHSFVEDARAQGFEPEIELVDCRAIQADTAIADLLATDISADLQKSVRVVRMDAHVTFVETEYVVVDRCDRFMRSGTLPVQRYSPLGESADITIRLRPINSQEAELFATGRNQPGLEQEQVIRDDLGVAFCLCRQIWRGELAQFSAKAILRGASERNR